MRHNTWRDRLQRSWPLLALLVLTGLAFAQDFNWSPIEWGSNPAIAALALGGITQMLRLKWPAIDGPFKVAGVAVIIGSAGGAVLQFIGLLTVLPYADMNAPLGGIAYGASLALFNATGIAVWNYLTGKVRPISVNVSDGLVPLAFAGAQAQSTASDFILGLVKNAVGAAQLPAALVAVAPLLAQFAQSDVILTDEVRSSIQAQVLKLLKRAGLIGVDL